MIYRLGADKAVIIRISGPIKSYWAQSNNLHFDKLLSAEAFKEQHRKDMISWSEKQRERDHGVFCRQAIEMYRGAVELLFHNYFKLVVLWLIMLFRVI